MGSTWNWLLTYRFLSPWTVIFPKLYLMVCPFFLIWQGRNRQYQFLFVFSFIHLVEDFPRNTVIMCAFGMSSSAHVVGSAPFQFFNRGPQFWSILPGSTLTLQIGLSIPNLKKISSTNVCSTKVCLLALSKFSGNAFGRISVYTAFTTAAKLLSFEVDAVFFLLSFSFPYGFFCGVTLASILRF